MTLTWTSKKFTDLTLPELYAVLQLRTEVFIVEQNCPFQDIDGQDQVAYHLLGHTPEGQLAAYARLFDAGQCYEQVCIGRVVVSPAWRRYGLGQELMRQAIAHCEQLFGTQPIKIGAQQYLTTFYQGFGFEQRGEMYLEDNIPHIYMERA
ncbi:GNAT family N-acetyltransferase [Hymenobacter cellulosilyticus]|uniref:GNAT family N-acetyltransferase n=1 Tax=Hymenobacter cellulosilyticus TaxID=2932248 RepID=A0A8T9Q2R3_9BACT|nr:GNAT family N-acetyltransferase [Hymenobacter cellulosilyticus]UOQ71824.1 GNAT family N-acetyltransferase [Hymenobacter cellulosilyticus]